MRLFEIAPPSPLQQAISYVASVAPFVNYKAGLLRGSATKGPIIQIPIRQDRKPRDSTMVASVLFNYWIEKALGIPNVRFRCLYATQSYTVACEYGDTVYCLMPENQATVVYHPGVSDSLEVLEQIDMEMKELNGDFINNSTLSVTDSAEVSVQKIIDALDPELVPQFNTLLQNPPEAFNEYVAVKAGNLTPNSGASPEFMILGVGSVMGLDAQLLHDHLNPEIRGDQYSATVVQLIDKALQNK